MNTPSRVALKLKAVIVKPGLWGLTRRDLRDAGRDAIEVAGDYWHARFKKLHFAEFAAAKYGYKRRTAAYQDRKDREHPEANGRPLVFTGESERRAMASVAVHATAKSFDSFKAEVIIDAPTLNYRQLADEVTRTLASEDVALQNVFAKEFTRRFLQAAESKTATVPATQLSAN